MGGGIDQKLMLAMMEGLADKSRLVDGKPTRSACACAAALQPSRCAACPVRSLSLPLPPSPLPPFFFGRLGDDHAVCHTTPPHAAPNAPRQRQRPHRISLIELGFNRIGMDDNWQACGTGINGSFHDAASDPDTTRAHTRPRHTCLCVPRRTLVSPRVVSGGDQPAAVCGAPCTWRLANAGRRPALEPDTVPGCKRHERARARTGTSHRLVHQQLHMFRKRQTSRWILAGGERQGTGGTWIRRNQGKAPLMLLVWH